MGLTPMLRPRLTLTTTPACPPPTLTTAASCLTPSPTSPSWPMSRLLSHTDTDTSVTTAFRTEDSTLEATSATTAIPTTTREPPPPPHPRLGGHPTLDLTER